MSFYLRRQKAFKPKGEPRIKNAQKQNVDGIWFHSKLEAARYCELKLLEKAGEVKILALQEHVYLTRARILYIPDFKIFDFRLNQEVYEETKGHENDRWPTVKKLWRVYGPAILRIYKGDYRRMRMVEEIHPKNPKISNQEPTLFEKGELE